MKPRTPESREAGDLGEGSSTNTEGQRFLGPVSGGETLARIIYLARGEDAAAAFNVRKFRDIFVRGLSVNRVRYLSKEELEAKAQKSVSESGGRKTGYRFAWANCGQIREYRRDGRQIFEVCATPTEDDPSHADIKCLIRIPKDTENSKALRQSIYEKIMRLFECADISTTYRSPP